MFKTIEIERFRGIRQTRIEGFRQINLFFGKNNCGKSSLLESIFLITGLTNPTLALQTNFVRGYKGRKRNDLILDFYKLDNKSPIRFRMEGKEQRDLKIDLVEQHTDNIPLHSEEEESLSNTEEGVYALRFHGQINDRSYFAQLQFDPQDPTKANRTAPSGYEEKLRCIYLAPKYDFYTSIQGLTNIIQNKDERFIVEGLQVIEPRIRDFVFTDGEILVDTGMAKRIPINLMGDGARKMVSLLTSIYDCKDGVLLVDEISNGFHHSVMRQLWQVLIQAAVRNNTQLFVTTHDHDSIRGLRDAAGQSKETEDLIAAFKLQRTPEDDLKAYHYSFESLDYALLQDIEIR